MKYGAIPTTLVERLAFLSGKVPVPVIDALFGPLKARAIMAAVRLGIFEAMRAGDHRPLDLARQLGLDADALELLLRALVLCDYLVQRHDGLFALSPLARRTMLGGAPMELVGYLRFNYAQWAFLGHLEELVRSGRGVDFHETMADEASWRDYQLGMLEIARMEARILAARVPVRRRATSLLDLAGSHGLFGAAICRKHPPMRSTVVELPPAVAHAVDLGREEGLTDIVSYCEGDILTADFGAGHDVVLLANILHHFDANRIASILKRARAALGQDGTVAIWEIEAPKRGSKVTAGDGSALYFRLTSTAGAYHGDEYANWVRAAGFARVKISRPAAAPGKVLVSARLEKY